MTDLYKEITDRDNHILQLEAEVAQLKEAGRVLVAANTRHFDCATRSYHEAQALRADIDMAHKEIDHWVSNHAQMKHRNALLSQRPDLPVDRIPSHAELIRLQEENAQLRRVHSSIECMNEIVGILRKLADSLDNS